MIVFYMFKQTTELKNFDVIGICEIGIENNIVQ